jgi:hypothetical protein
VTAEEVAESFPVYPELLLTAPQPAQALEMVKEVRDAPPGGSSHLGQFDIRPSDRQPDPACTRAVRYKAGQEPGDPALGRLGDEVPNGLFVPIHPNGEAFQQSGSKTAVLPQKAEQLRSPIGRSYHWGQGRGGLVIWAEWKEALFTKKGARGQLIDNRLRTVEQAHSPRVQQVNAPGRMLGIKDVGPLWKLQRCSLPLSIANPQASHRALLRRGEQDNIILLPVLYNHARFLERLLNCNLDGGEGTG